jgi:gliding motility-associated-like protein
MKSFTAETREYGDEPEVEELFTPNGDGFNDHWEILNLVKMAPCETEVYNRRGERVFSSSDYNNDWDGTWKGKSLPNDTYYYFVRCYNKKLAKGTVNILK